MRFTFGRNWNDFSRVLDASRVEEAERSLVASIEPASLQGRSFLDLGSGSGLFSIAATRLGAVPVLAIDCDEECVRVARQNAARFLSPDEQQRIRFGHGDVLDLATLGTDVFDVVYAWGSLHHTGRMWEAIDNAASRCAVGGLFVVALYNKTRVSPAWLRIKQVYHRAPRWAAFLMAGALGLTRSVARAVRGRNPFRTERGMSVWYDAIDWLGGLPYEAASSAEVEDFLRSRGFEVRRRQLTTRSGCNEFVFCKVADGRAHG